jgi:hypothetical protein
MSELLFITEFDYLLLAPYSIFEAILLTGTLKNTRH